MKRYINLIIITINIAITSSLFCQNSYIYGIHTKGCNSPAYLVKLDYLAGQYDTVLFLGVQNINTNTSCIDSYNGRLFLSGELFGQDYSIHIINLNTLETISHPIQHNDIRDMEYNLLNNSIIYREGSEFWKFNLETCTEILLGNLGITTGSYSGDVSSYNPIDNTHIHLGQGHNFIIKDGFTGEVTNTVYADLILGELVVDYESGKQFALFSEGIYQFNPFTGEIIELLKIPDYSSWPEGSRAVFDQVNKKYIIPYLSTAGNKKISIIDMYNFTIDTTYIHPDYLMYLENIYCKPKTQLSLINNTFYVSYGQNYEWYLDGILKPAINTQYYSTFESGDYQTLVEYLEYTSLSNPVSYLNTYLQTDSSESDIFIFPNPFYQTIKILGDPDVINNSQLIIFNSKGENVYQIEISDIFIFNLETLNSGFYSFQIIKNGKIQLSEKMVKIN